MIGFKLNRKQAELPEPARMSLRAEGTTLIWSVAFREAMINLARRRGLPAILPLRVRVAALEALGILLMWPAAAGDSDGFPVRLSPKERRVSVTLTRAFRTLDIRLPLGVAVEIPVSPHCSAEHGQCLALHFSRAEFLYRRSRSSAMGLLPDTFDED